MTSRSFRSLRRYYEWNTELFLRLSGGASTLSLHRPVWGENVNTRDEAFAYPYRLVLQTVRQVTSSTETAPTAHEPGRGESPRDRFLRVLDLGCGVGGGIQYLLNHVDVPLRATGVTLSPTQVERARREARRRGFDPNRYDFLEADFYNLPSLEAVEVAFAIEAFALAEQSGAFFEAVARVLRPGGHLVLIDDFFADPASERSLSPPEQQWVETIRDGWHAHGLCSVSAATKAAEAYDLRLVDTSNLTSYLPLNRPRDRFIEWCIVPLRPLLWHWPYFRGLIGGDALQKCLKAGIIEYRHLVFEREETT